MVLAVDVDDLEGDRDVEEKWLLSACRKVGFNPKSQPVGARFAGDIKRSTSVRIGGLELESGPGPVDLAIERDCNSCRRKARARIQNVCANHSETLVTRRP